MFETIQKNLLEVLQFHEICSKFFYQELGHSSQGSPLVSLPQVLPYFPSIRQKLEETLQQTKLLCDTNIHCLAKITVLQQENQELSQRYEVRIQQLEDQVNSLTHALDHQKTLQANYSNFANLHGFWKAILHHAMVTPTLFNDETGSSDGNKANGNEHASSSIISTILNRSPALNKQQILEVENMSAKLLNWLAITSYQAIAPPSNPQSPAINRSNSFHQLSSLNKSLHSSSFDSISRPLLSSSMMMQSQFPGMESSLIDSEEAQLFKEWTQTMIQQVQSSTLNLFFELSH